MKRDILKLFLFVIAGAMLHAQQPSKVISIVESAELQSAKKPVESWMGHKLTFFEGTGTSPEALIAKEGVAVSMTQVRAFRSSQELAEFLAHAAAHARLGHSFVLSAPAVMEDAAVPVAAELMETAGCAPAGSCGMFGLLLRAARRL